MQITASLPGLKPLFFRHGTCVATLPKNSKPALRWECETPLSHHSVSHSHGRNNDNDSPESLSRSSTRLPDAEISKEEEFFDRRHPELLPINFHHNMPRSQVLAKVRVPQRPGIVERPSFYTAMYGSTKRVSFQKRDSQSAIIVGTVVETFSTPRSEGRNSLCEQDRELSAEIRSPSPVREEGYTVSVSAQTSILSSRTSISSTMGIGESKSNRPMSMWTASSRPGEEGNVLRSTMKSLGFGKSP